MNKSKFLKKSLAALLAVMLVVAMIPLSAAAVASGDYFPKVFVNTKETTIVDGGNYTADVTSLGDVSLTWAPPSTNMPSGTTMTVEFIGKSGQTVPSTMGNLENFATKNGNDYTLTVKVTVTDERDASAPTKVEDEYDLVITLKEDAAKDNANIRDIYISGVTGTVSNVDNLITLSMGFGATLPTELQAPAQPFVGTVSGGVADGNFEKLKNWFTPAALDHVNKMTWTYNSAPGAVYPYTLKVETEGGTSKTFNVKQEWEKGFTSFTVPNQIGETRINTTGDKIDIDMPATTDFSKLIVPTFTLETSKQVKVETKSTQGAITGANVIGTAGSPSNVAVTSGVTGLDFSLGNGSITGTGAPTGNDKAVLLNVTDKDGKVHEVIVTLHPQAYNTNELKSVEFKVVNATAGSGAAYLGSVKTDVAESGATTVYVTHNATLGNADIKVVASAGATVSVDGQDITVTKTNPKPTGVGTHDEEYVLADVDVKTGTVTIRVTPEDGSPSKEYVINLVKDIDEGQIRSFFIKNGTNTYVGNINTTNKSVIVDVPYSEGYFDNASSGLRAYKVFAIATSGSTITIENTKTIAGGVFTNGAILGDKTVNDIFKKADGTNYYVPGTDMPVIISTPDADPVTWTIRLNVGKPSYGHTLFNSGNEIVGTNNLGKITADNTYTDITVGTGTDTNGNKINTIEVKVPYSFDATDLSFTKMNLSENAKLVLGTGSAYSKNVTEMPTDSYANHTMLIDSVTANDITSAVGTDERIIKSKTKELIVMSQDAYGNNPTASATAAGATDANVNVAYANLNGQNSTTYYLYCVKKPAETGAEIISIESTTDKNVTARLNPVTKHVEITVPYSYSVPNTASVVDYSKVVGKFSLNFTLSSQANMKGIRGQDGTTLGDVINSDKGATTTTNRTTFFAWDGNLCYNKDLTNENISSVEGTNYYRITGGSTPDKATPGTLGTTGKLVVTSESGTVTNEYPIDFKVALEQTEAKLLTLSANGISGTIGELDTNSKAEVNLQLPVGTQLTEQTLDLTVSKMAKVTVNGFEYSADRKFDLSKDATIKVVSEDKSKENTYVLKTTLRQGFDDVHESDWFYSEVMEAVANGWINGRGNGIFDPYGNMTRGDFAVIIARMDKSFDKTDSEGCPFPDVTGEEYQAAAKYVYEKGYMTGDPDGSFAQNRAINRQEAAKVMCIMNGIAEEGGETTYADNANIAAWAKGYVKAATTAGIFKGEGADFNPGRQLRRCEGAAVLVRSKK